MRWLGAEGALPCGGPRAEGVQLERRGARGDAALPALRAAGVQSLERFSSRIKKTVDVSGDTQADI